MRIYLLAILAAVALVGCGKSEDAGPTLTAAQKAEQAQNDPRQTPEGQAAEAERQRLAQAQGEAMKRAGGH